MTIDLPFDARAAFGKPKGTLYVAGTIDQMAFRSNCFTTGMGKKPGKACASLPPIDDRALCVVVIG